MGWGWLINESESRPRTRTFDQLELRASQQLVAVVDILLGLTLVEGAFAYRGMFTESSTINWPAGVAFVLVNFTAIRSFVDWHIAMEARPYRVLTDDWRRTELARVSVDFMLMASYSFLILRCHVLIAHPASNLLVVSIVYVAIYAGYFLWNRLRNRVSVGVDLREPFAPLLLILVGVGAGGLVALYAFGHGESWFGLDGSWFNAVFLALELVLMAAYRHLNWKQQVRLKSEPAGGTTKDRTLQWLTEMIAGARSKGPAIEHVKNVENLENLKAAVAALDGQTVKRLISSVQKSEESAAD